MADVRRRLGIIALVIFVVAVGIPLAAELISARISLAFLEIITVLETIGTLSLSAILAYLYTDIRDIQSNQEELMRVQYEPEVKVTISSGSEEYPVILVRNSGSATALELRISLKIGDNSRSIYHPYLSAGATIEYPVYSDTRPLSTEEIMERIELEPDESDEPFSSNIEPLENEIVCDITCRDVKGDPHEFVEQFDLKDTLMQLEDFRIRTEVDALEGISSELEVISDELREQNNDLL